MGKAVVEHGGKVHFLHHVQVVPAAALSAGLSEGEVALITEADEGYVLKFKTVELWEKLKARLAE